MGHKDDSAITSQLGHGAQGSDNHMAQWKQAGGGGGGGGEDGEPPRPRGFSCSELLCRFTILSFVGITRNRQPKVFG